MMREIRCDQRSAINLISPISQASVSFADPGFAERASRAFSVDFSDQRPLLAGSLRTRQPELEYVSIFQFIFQ